MSIIDTIFSKPDLYTGKGASNEDIQKAEQELDLVFSLEYKEYLKIYGVVSYKGHELTGLFYDDRINVVSVTKACRNLIPSIPKNMYVIEEMNFDGFVLWQDASGKIYETQYDSSPKQIYDSLEEYIFNE